MSTEWTDEKHSLYLKSMEASFVDQLYNSMNLLGVQVQDKMSNPKLSQQVHCNAHVPSGQVETLPFFFQLLPMPFIVQTYTTACLFIDENSFLHILV